MEKQNMGGILHQADIPCHTPVVSKQKRKIWSIVSSASPQRGQEIELTEIPLLCRAILVGILPLINLQTYILTFVGNQLFQRVGVDDASRGLEFRMERTYRTENLPFVSPLQTHLSCPPFN
ncbi:hypothetical protein HanRHA438_Chr09g0402091 [Helianthus annuus]|nr:hypothetical protein HanIR_Chr09g0421151 [Helianthus annuus]KAJ0888444.1 hypothetical protein HanRHA438_Chr09g0402091 [Helianthus annuus]